MPYAIKVQITQQMSIEISGDKIDNALIVTSLSNEEGLTAKKFYKKALAVKETQTLAEKK